MSTFAIVAVVVIVAVVIYVKRNKIKAPPLIVPTESLQQKTSVIQMPITVSSLEIKQAVMKELDSPLVEGKSDEINATILTSETITEEELVKTLVAPAKPGYWITKYKKVEKTFRESFGCWLKPWKWGKCFKNVVKLVTVPFQAWIEPIEAVYKYVAQNVIKVIDKAFDAGVRVVYKVNLTKLDLDCQAQTVSVDTAYKADLSIEYKSNIIPFSNTLQLKGSLDGSLETALDIKGDIRIDDNAELQVNLPTDGVEITFTKLNLPTAIKGVNFQAIMRPVLKVINETVMKLVSKQVVKQIKKKLTKSKDDLTFGDEIKAFVAKNNGAISIAEDAWFLPYPEKVSFSQIHGSGKGNSNEISITVGISGKPNLVISAKKPKAKKQKELQVVTEAMEPRAYLYPGIHIGYNFTATLIEENLTKAFNENEKLKKLPVITGKTKIYPSDKKLVVSIELLMRSNSKRIVTFFLWGQPVLEPENKTVRLKDIEYTVESKSFLINLINELVDDKIIEVVSEKAVFDYSEQLSELTSKISRFEQTTDFGRIKGTLDHFNGDGLATAKDKLTVYLEAEGVVSFDIDIPEEDVVLKGKTIPTVKLDEANRIAGMVPAVMHASESQNEKEAMPSPFINIGDEIFVEDKSGHVTKKIAGPKDATLPGEPVLMQRDEGDYVVVRQDM